MCGAGDGRECSAGHVTHSIGSTHTCWVFVSSPMLQRARSAEWAQVCWLRYGVSRPGIFSPSSECKYENALIGPDMSEHSWPRLVSGLKRPWQQMTRAGGAFSCLGGSCGAQVIAYVHKRIEKPDTFPTQGSTDIVHELK